MTCLRVKCLRVNCALVLSLCGALAYSSEMDAWPQFLGPGGRATQELADPPADLDREDCISWKTVLPIGHSSPCVWGSSIFLTGYTKDSKSLETICIDRSSGTIRWRHSCPEVDKIEKVHRVSSPAASTPVTDGETVVSYFGSYGLVAYDYQGNERWRHQLPMAKVMMNHGSGSSPIIADGRVILFVSLGGESYLGAFDLTDGSELWKGEPSAKGRTWATPITWLANDQLHIGLLASARFMAFDASDGSEQWWVQGLATNAGASPMLIDDKVLMTSAGMQGDEDNIIIPEDFDSFLAKHDKNGDSKIAFQEIPDSVLFTDRHTSDGAGNMKLKQALRFTGIKPNDVFDREQWEEGRKMVEQLKNGAPSRPSARFIGLGGAGNATQTNRIWEVTKGIGEVPSPLVYRGQVYLIKNGGVLTVLAAQTGKRIYTRRLQNASGGYYATPVAAKGRIYFASDAGVVTVIEAGPTLQILSQRDLEEPIYATPALVGNSIYVRTKNHLYAMESE